MFSSDFVDTVFTPIVGIIAAGNKKHIDVFEEQFAEINDINFLEGGKSISPYNIDYGSRFCYGTKISMYKKDGHNLAYFTLGRTTDITEAVQKSEATGLKQKNSNIVTSLDLFLTDELTFVFNGSYSTRKKEWTRSLYGIKATYQKVYADALVFKGKQSAYNPFFSYANDEDRDEEYKGSMFDLNFQVSNNIKLKGGLVFGTEKSDTNKQVGRRLIKQNIGMEYQNECTSIDMMIEQTKYRHGDIKPQTNFTFVITLKNFGS